MPDKIEPNEEDLKRFVAEDDGGEFCMLNMLKFIPGDGATKYAEYGEKVMEHLARVGAEAVYIGQLATTLAAPERDTEYDMIALVRYPSRQAFMEMVMNEEYLKIAPLRVEALESTVLQVTIPVPGS